MTQQYPTGWIWPIEDTSVGAFHYIGQALTPLEFRNYCINYKNAGLFGIAPPTYWVWHHSVNPDASWAPKSSNQATWWDRNEQGMTTAQKKAKRKSQLDSIMRFYRDTNKWEAGPHLFVDDLFVWLFTPMFYLPVAQNEGNAYHTPSGDLRYGIACEVIGFYDTIVWPGAIYRNAGYACACVQHVLGFELKYTSAPQDRPDLHDPELSGHRDYTTEKTCPGRAITPPFYVQAAKDGVTAYNTSSDPLRAKTLPSVNNQPVYCSFVAYTYYNAHGGVSVLGLPLKDEYPAIDPNGVTCSVLKCEKVAIKTSAKYGTELMLIEQEALPMGVFVKP